MAGLLRTGGRTGRPTSYDQNKKTKALEYSMNDKRYAERRAKPASRVDWRQYRRRTGHPSPGVQTPSQSQELSGSLSVTAGGRLRGSLHKTGRHIKDSFIGSPSPTLETRYCTLIDWWLDYTWPQHCHYIVEVMKTESLRMRSFYWFVIWSRS